MIDVRLGKPTQHISHSNVLRMINVVDWSFFWNLNALSPISIDFNLIKPIQSHT